MNIKRPTDSSRFQLAADLFDAARQLPAKDRRDFLRQACAEDQALQQDVENLLQHHDQQDGFLENPVAMKSTFGQALNETLSKEPLPEQIGGYPIRGLLGKGGMGIVYLAEQANPRRKCAIKVIRPAVLDSGSRQRFQLETELLGRLQNPGIAQIYEAGVHHDSLGDRPFFAMEFVKGLPLIQHIGKHKLSVQERLNLLIEICDTVHYAHQKGVIHRDLKPGNILVSKNQLVDASTSSTASNSSERTTKPTARPEWQPKILDFGVACLADRDGGLHSRQTRVGQFIGTVPYMSPEQIQGRTDEVDTRSDVYALGVIAFELLTGQLPYELDKCSLAEAVAKVGEQRSKTPAEIDRQFRGDLNTIVMCALQPAPEKRYQSANDFAADIRRFLNDQPIEARTPSVPYLLKKFAQRNRVLVAAGATILVTMIAAIVISTGFASAKAKALAESQQHLATAETKQEEAEANFEQARNAIDRLADLSRQLSTVPGTDDIRQQALAEVVQFYSSHVKTSDDPSVTLQVAQTLLRLGQLRAELFQFENAQKDIERAQSILERLRDNYPDQTTYPQILAGSYFQKGGLLAAMGRPQEAMESHKASADLFLLCWAGQQNDQFQISRACSLNNAAGSAMAAGKRKEAIEYCQQAIELFEKHGAKDSFHVLFNQAIAFETKAVLLKQAGQPRSSLSFYQKALTAFQAGIKNGLDHPSNLDYLGRVRNALALTHLELDLKTDDWKNEATEAGRYFRARWTARQDRPALGLLYAAHCRFFANAYWQTGDQENGERLFRQASKTLTEIREQHGSFVNELQGVNVTIELWALTTLCPVTSLRDLELSKRLANELKENFPDYLPSKQAASISKTLLGEVSNESLDGKPDDSFTMLLGIAKQARMTGAVSPSDREVLEDSQRNLFGSNGLESLLADRILAILDER